LTSKVGGNIGPFFLSALKTTPFIEENLIFLIKKGGHKK